MSPSGVDITAATTSTATHSVMADIMVAETMEAGAADNFCTMRTYITKLNRTPVIAILLIASMLALDGCNSGPFSTLTQENLDKIQTGMSSAQVKAILGEPTESKTEPIPIVGGTKTTFTYTNNQSNVVIVLKNDQVQTKEGTFGSGQ
jgi:hypothetical protein